MHEYSSSMHIKKLKIAHYPTRKFVQINELCSLHFHSQKRKKKEKEVRKSRTSVFAFRKEDSSGLSSRRGGKVKWNALYYYVVYFESY